MFGLSRPDGRHVEQPEVGDSAGQRVQVGRREQECERAGPRAERQPGHQRATRIRQQQITQLLPPGKRRDALLVTAPPTAVQGLGLIDEHHAEECATSGPLEPGEPVGDQERDRRDHDGKRKDDDRADRHHRGRKGQRKEQRTHGKVQREVGKGSPRGGGSPRFHQRHQHTNHATDRAGWQP